MTGYRGLLVACALIGASPSVLAQGASNNPLERAYFAQKRGEPTPEALELASRYVEGRAGALRIPDVATFTLSPDLVSVLVAESLRRVKTQRDWNENNPEWKRMAAGVERDLAKLRDDLTADPRQREFERQAAQGVVRGVATRLGADQVRELVAYYASPAGKQLAALQSSLVAEAQIGVMFLKRLAALGERPPDAKPPSDDREFKQVIGLLDDYVRLQWALLDPVQGGDRSVVRAIPIQVSKGTQANWAKIEGLWRAVPEADRTALLAWRDSPIAKAERAAVFEAMRDARNAVGFPAEIQRVTQSIAQVQQRWQAEMRPPEPRADSKGDQKADQKADQKGEAGK